MYTAHSLMFYTVAVKELKTLQDCSAVIELLHKTCNPEDYPEESRQLRTKTTVMNTLRKYDNIYHGDLYKLGKKRFVRLEQKWKKRKFELDIALDGQIHFSHHKETKKGQLKTKEGK
jgi:hypothetical protein